MINLKVSNTTKSREEWIQLSGLPADLHQSVLQSDVLIVPSELKDNPQAFMVGTMDFFAYLQAHLGQSVEICVADDDYVEIELNSKMLRLGHINVKAAVLTILLNLLSNYIYNSTLAPKQDTVAEVNEVTPQFMTPPAVSFTVSVSDTTGKSKEFQYEGPASDLESVNAQILKLWNED